MCRSCSRSCRFQQEELETTAAGEDRRALVRRLPVPHRPRAGHPALASTSSTGSSTLTTLDRHRCAGRTAAPTDRRARRTSPASALPSRDRSASRSSRCAPGASSRVRQRVAGVRVDAAQRAAGRQGRAATAAGRPRRWAGFERDARPSRLRSPARWRTELGALRAGAGRQGRAAPVALPRRLGAPAARGRPPACPAARCSRSAVTAAASVALQVRSRWASVGGHRARRRRARAARRRCAPPAAGRRAGARPARDERDRYPLQGRRRARPPPRVGRSAARWPTDRARTRGGRARSPGGAGGRSSPEAPRRDAGRRTAARSRARTLARRPRARCSVRPREREPVVEQTRVDRRRRARARRASSARPDAADRARARRRTTRRSHAFAIARTAERRVRASLTPARAGALDGELPLRQGTWDLCPAARRRRRPSSARRWSPARAATTSPRSHGRRPQAVHARRMDARRRAPCSSSAARPRRGRARRLPPAPPARAGLRRAPRRAAARRGRLHELPAAASTRTARARSTRSWSAASAPLEHLWVVQRRPVPGAATARPSCATAAASTTRRWPPPATSSPTTTSPTGSSGAPDQVCLQTWHGTPLKRLGFDVAEPRKAVRPLRAPLAAAGRTTGSTSLSPNRFSTPILRRAYAIEGEMLETGYPRNDMLAGAGPRGARRAQLRARLGMPEGERVVLYAPTYRDHVWTAAAATGSTCSSTSSGCARRVGRGHGDPVPQAPLHRRPGADRPPTASCATSRPTPTAPSCCWPPTCWSPTTRR